MADRRLAEKGQNSFNWLPDGAVPETFDLRRCGWTLISNGAAPGDCVSIIAVTEECGEDWINKADDYPRDRRAAIVVTGVADSAHRTTLLEKGYGDALPGHLCIEELGHRAARVAEALRNLPRVRMVGPLRLDLLEREAYILDKPLNLNPREFALLWRLTDSVNQSVSKQALIRDVWRLGFVPETNSIAVHMSRLRRKLSLGGLDDMIETVASGGYRLRVPAHAWEIAAAKAVSEACSPNNAALLHVSALA